MEQVILVDENDRELGVMEKLRAHQEAKLHRALSVFVFNDRGELLLQRRAAEKYHSPNLWTNTCCSHPRPQENVLDAAKRRLQEEMGFTCELNAAFSFVYKADMENGLTEHEFDHVFFGTYNQAPTINTTEVCEWKYETLETIAEELKKNPENFTAWFKIIFERVAKLKK